MNDTTPTPNLLARAAAIRLGVSRRVLADLCNKGELTYSLVAGGRRFAEADLDAWLAKMRRPAKEVTP